LEVFLTELKFPSDATLSEMARAVILWSILEFEVDIGIAATLRIPYGKFHLAINPIWNFPARLKILRNLIDFEFCDDSIKLIYIKELFTKISKHYDFRNSIVHYHWYAIEADPNSPNHLLVNALLSHHAYSISFERDNRTKAVEPVSHSITPKKLNLEIHELPKTTSELEALIHNYQEHDAKRSD